MDRRTPRGPIAAALLALALGCDQEAPHAPLPEGTVMLLDGEPILAAEVDRIAERMHALYPPFTLTNRRRQALLRVVFPLRVAQEKGGPERAAARARAAQYLAEVREGAQSLAEVREGAQSLAEVREGAQSLAEVREGAQSLAEVREGAQSLAEVREGAQSLAEVREGAQQGPLAEPDEGTWVELGLHAWLGFSQLAPGEWSEVREEPGGFVVVQLLERDGNPKGAVEIFRVRIERFPYRTRDRIDREVFEAQLEIVDPAWREVVPGKWRYEMAGDER